MTYGELEQGLHLMAVVEHCAVDYAFVVISKMLQVLVVGGNDTKRLLQPELLQHGFGNGTANHGFSTATELIY